MEAVVDVYWAVNGTLARFLTSFCQSEAEHANRLFSVEEKHQGRKIQGSLKVLKTIFK